MKLPTLIKNISTAQTVATNFQHKALRKMKELTTVVNHSAASNVINPQHQIA